MKVANAKVSFIVKTIDIYISAKSLVFFLI